MKKGVKKISLSNVIGQFNSNEMNKVIGGESHADDANGCYVDNHHSGFAEGVADGSSGNAGTNGDWLYNLGVAFANWGANLS